MIAPKFIEHRGTNILYIDFSNLKIDDQQDAVDRITAARDAVGKNPHNSLLILTNVENAQFDKEIAKQMREYVAHNKPYVKKSAVFGLKGLQIPLYNAINKITGRNMRSFGSLQQAKEWLIGN